MIYAYYVHNIQHGWSVNTITKGLREHGFRVVDINPDTKTVAVELEFDETSVCAKILSKLGFPPERKPITQADKLIALVGANGYNG